MSANKEAKVKIVDEIKAELSSAKSILFVDYRGITVAEDTQLRKEFRQDNVKYRVYKNRLMLKALEELGITGFDTKSFEGTTAIAFSTDEVAPARIFVNTVNKLNKMDVKFGILDGKIMPKDEVVALSKIPSKPELIAHLLGQLQAPISALARVLNSIAEAKQN